MPKPVVASYCTTFLKPEMLHIYRQVTGLQRYGTFVITKERRCEEKFPFEEIEIQPPRMGSNFIRRFYLKHVRKLPPIYYRGELRVIHRILERRHADLMHIYFGHTGVHLLPFMRNWDRPCVVSFHGADVMLRPHQPEYEGRLKEVFQVAELILARSDSLACRLEELGCPPEKIRMNRTGIPMEEFPYVQRMMPTDNEWRLVQASRLIPKKGLCTALRAFAIFHRRYPKATYTIAGEGPMLGELQALAGELGVGEAVKFIGFQDSRALNKLYACSHLFLHPSELTSDANQEGVPNAMLEAMATGLPVAATLHGGIPEAVKNEWSGFLVPERSPDQLAAALERMVESSEYLHILGQRAAEAVREEFEQGSAIRQLETVYDEAVVRRSRPHAAMIST